MSKKSLAILLCIVMAVSLFTGCQNYQARRTVPNYPVNYRDDYFNRGNNMLPNDMRGNGLLNQDTNYNTANPNRYPGMYNNNYAGTGTGRFGVTPGTTGAGNDGTTYGNGGIISPASDKADVAYCKSSTPTKVRNAANANSPVVATVPANQMMKVLDKIAGFYVVQIPNTNKVGCVPTNQVKNFSNTTTNAQPIPNAGVNTGTNTGTNNILNGLGLGTNRNTTTGTGTNTGTNPGTTGTTTNTGKTTGTTAATMTADETRILQLCNTERAKIGAKPLKSNMEVTKLARLKSQDMVNNNYFSHESPTYGSPFDMMKKYGVSYMYAGENIAMNQSADKAFQAWMNSPGHKKNILNPDFTELGVGISPKGNGSYIYTQMFIGR